MSSLKVISITHKRTPLELIGKLHLSEEHQQEYLPSIKIKLQLSELSFLSTCNRVELIVCTDQVVDQHFLQQLFIAINSELSDDILEALRDTTNVYEGSEAIEHLFNVASSLDSLVVGEREIITQVRKAYEFCNSLGITGDTIRLVIKQTIETAKQVYTDTDIARNQVSVVSLAYRQLRDLGIKNTARIVFVGAGETIINIAKYFKKHEYANFTVFNRTLHKAQLLASDLKGNSFELKTLATYTKGFDVLITCTSAEEPIITPVIYKQLVGNDLSKKIIIDLAIPKDIDARVLNENEVCYIDIESLKKQAADNLIKREQEIYACQAIIKDKVELFKHLLQERKIELAFGEIPKQVKFIKENALNEVFAKELKMLDIEGKEVLDKVLNYMEKKYNALAIKTAKKVFLEETDL